MASRLQRNADKALRDRADLTLNEFLIRAKAEQWTYEMTAQELYLLTEGLVGVSFSTVRRWLDDHSPTANGDEAA